MKAGHVIQVLAVAITIMSLLSHFIQLEYLFGSPVHDEVENAVEIKPHIGGVLHVSMLDVEGNVSEEEILDELQEDTSHQDTQTEVCARSPFVPRRLTIRPARASIFRPNTHETSNCRAVERNSKWRNCCNTAGEA